MNLISVIVPVYNVEKYLDRCVKSILAQTYENFELILVDDGSPDNCPEMCNDWAKKDSRITVIHQKNGGLSAARNAGIEYAMSKEEIQWIFFIDSDDWIHEKTLECLLNANLENKTDVSICVYEETDGEQPIVNSGMLCSEIVNTEDFYVNHIINAIIACGKLYKKECFSYVRYPVGKLHEDSFTTYKILFKYKKLSFINQPLYSYYKNPNSIMKSPWRPKRLEDLAAIKEEIKFFSKNKYFNAYKCAIHLLFCLVYSHFFILQRINGDKKYKRVVNKEMRNAIHKYKKIEGITFKNDKKYYDVAYPLFMRFYWIIVSKLKK